MGLWEKKMTYTEKRWALVTEFDWGLDFLGKYCHLDATPNEPIIRTFRTRAEARLAKKQASYSSESRVVAAEVITRIRK